MADGARGRSRGLDGSKHAGITNWHVGMIMGKCLMDLWIYSMGNVSSEGRPVRGKQRARAGR